MVGPGTGTFAIIAFTSLMGFDLRTANGNAKVLNLASNYASLFTYLSSGLVVFPGGHPLRHQQHRRQHHRLSLSP